jgi:hypothetical protein
MSASDKNELGIAGLQDDISALRRDVASPIEQRAETRPIRGMSAK